ncbi:TRPM8 channel-associated factor homolog [Epinephelus moara]|uniref:TRPM8 channel-associated factor homolog n=1 Tax=Epinephelus moara TaxID=300413 RepID=UPI00214E5DD3|nr:TRPM8 channel-associated factor homolog [Epinephelus moara]
MSTHPTQSYHNGAYMSLMKGLKELDLRGSSVPCDLVLTGDDAFPLAMNSQGQVLMAASLFGCGRIVVLGHETYLYTFPALVENALTWLRGDGSDNLSVGFQQNSKAVADNLSKSSFQAKVVEAFSDKVGVGVYVTDAYSVGADVKELVAFLKAGGGVLIAGQAWHWASTHPKENTVLQFPGNKVSGVAGIYFSTDYGNAEIIPVHPQIPSSWKALRLGKNFEDDLEFLLQGISEFDWADALSSEVLVHGPLAFPIGTTEDGRVFLAGGYYGKGRVIVIGHEALLTIEVQCEYSVTTAAEWSSLRTAPAPWAELECDNIIISAPSDFVRGLEHPEKVAAVWDEIMKGVADLAAIPHKLPRKERFVADVQISAGLMHSGYPVMMHTYTVSEVFRVGDDRTVVLWGEIHELGHNQQRAPWEFRPHTGEATNNLWSVYVHEEVLGINREKAHPSMTSTERKNTVDHYVKGGRKLSDWHVWTALETYLQLQEKFGWDAFKKVFAAYHKISNYPSDNEGKMNLYAETFSQIVGKNLTGFFKAWGWPIATATEEKLSNLPRWSDHPMAKYDKSN